MTLPSDGFADGGEFYTDEELAYFASLEDRTDLDDDADYEGFDEWLDDLDDDDFANVTDDDDFDDAPW
jgi:hypothetical protein